MEQILFSSGSSWLKLFGYRETVCCTLMISLIQLKKLCSNVLIWYAIYSKCLNLLCEEDVEETPPDQIFSTYAQAKIINVDDSFVEHNSSTSQVVL